MTTEMRKKTGRQVWRHGLGVHTLASSTRQQRISSKLGLLLHKADWRAREFSACAVGGRTSAVGEAKSGI